MLKEFKAFISKGNVIDLAVGVIIGGAFQKIVSSLVDDIIMPAISFITGKVNIADLGFTYNEITINYGSFIATIIDFLIIAFSIFIAIYAINNFNKNLNTGLGKISKGKLGKKEKKEEPTTKKCPYCLSVIDIKATRCPHCTSVLEEKTIKK